MVIVIGTTNKIKNNYFSSNGLRYKIYRPSSIARKIFAKSINIFIQMKNCFYGKEEIMTRMFDNTVQSHKTVVE